MGDAALAYVGHVLDLIAAEWFRADDIDLPDLRRRHLAAAAHAETEEQTHDIVEVLIGELGDGHSHLIRPGRLAEIAARQPPLPEGRMQGRAACLVVSWFMLNRHVSRESFAGRLQDLSAVLDAERPAGWVVDLRRNGGGDMWPMLAGLGPLLGEGPFGSFVAARTFAWTYRDGTAFNGGHPMCRREGTPVIIRHAGSKVAVLMGPGTASAGEAVALAFRGRSETRFFGQPTAGQSTANGSYVLSDGAVLALTGALMADRDGVGDGRALTPDVVVPLSVDDPAPDPALDSAVDWVIGEERRA